MSILPHRLAPVPFVAALASFGDRPALVTDRETLSYAALADRVEAFAARLGNRRRLVLLEGAHDPDTLVAYLGALAGGHPVLLTAPDAPHRATLEAAYDPDVVVRGGRIEERRPGSRHDLHPDLALLLSTSGSTGSPKLVRLGAESLQANAESIAAYLSIRDTDVAVTTLPMHYCYGLSVLHSHLLRGAAVLLTDLSVVDACFWDQFRRHRATSLAAVPFTFDLLDRVGFESMDLPSLRYVTQAGGPLAPDRVVRYAELGRRRGFDLFVMYGQTEATARMAYLPPDLALTHPGAIGRPVPGGSLRIVPLDGVPPEESALDPATGEPAVGELVYAGPNVMLGYAEEPADLALGRVVTELRTGDVARRTGDGLVEVVGRRDRFTKLFGLRIDLDRAESLLAAAGIPAWCTATEEALVVGVEGSGTDADGVRADVRRLARQQLGLPAGGVRVVVAEELPRLPTGKPDRRALVRLARDGVAAPEPTAVTGDPATDLCVLYAEVLGRRDVTVDDSFAGLGGDSLSYVEMSLRLEQSLGHLPAGWHLAPIRELVPRETRSRLRTLETNVLLRAAAIVAIVGTHGNLFVLTGGAHLLLALVGFNFARFHLPAPTPQDRVRRLAGALGRVVVPSVLWIGGAAVLASAYSWPTVGLVNGLVGSRGWSEPAWHYWFIEATVHTLLVVLALTTVPFVHRAVQRWPFWLPVGLAVVALVTRYDLVSLRGGDEIHRAHVLFWLFALGWASATASTHRHRLVVSALVVLTVPGFLGDPAREAVVVVGMLLLLWVRQVRVPDLVARVAGVLASASLYIYLSHWQVYPHLEDDRPLLAVLASLAVGVLLWQLVSRVSGPSRRGRRSRAAR